jgi:3D (Asp-Asp-Asp) domain-containing protein
MLKTLLSLQTHLAAFLLALSLLIFASPSYATNLRSPYLQNTSENNTPSYLISPTIITTETKFSSKVTVEEKIIPFTTIYKDNPDAEVGNDTILQEGQNGRIETEITTTYYEGKEFERNVTNVEKIEPVDKIISRGTKIVLRTLNTPNGDITYYRKIRTWATSYYPFCRGCSGTGRTALGLKAGYGIVAVDPKIIKLGSRVYIPGYGIALAGDTGGAIKGNIIDLGFDENDDDHWSAHYTDVYLLP